MFALPLDDNLLYKIIMYSGRKIYKRSVNFHGNFDQIADDKKSLYVLTNKGSSVIISKNTKTKCFDGNCIGASFSESRQMV